MSYYRNLQYFYKTSFHRNSKIPKQNTSIVLQNGHTKSRNYIRSFKAKICKKSAVIMFRLYFNPTFEVFQYKFILMPAFLSKFRSLVYQIRIWIGYMIFLGNAEAASPGTMNVRGGLVYDAPFDFGGNLIVLQLPNMSG